MEDLKQEEQKREREGKKYNTGQRYTWLNLNEGG